MHFELALAVFLGFASTASAVPASADPDLTPAKRGLKHRSWLQRRNPLIIQQTVVEPQIVVVEQNLDVVNQLAQIAEQEFAALVQSQVALVSQLEDIKNNIRQNHFKARFSQVNTVIVTVTNVVDQRDPQNVNKRYLVNQLLADNGVPDKQLLVMVTQAQDITIGATPTFNLNGLVGTASAVSLPTGKAAAVAGFDPNAPFGQFNFSQILPYNTTAPKNAIILEDPANIIFPNQNSLFVENIQNLNQDCTQALAQSGELLNLAEVQLFGSLAQAAAAQLAGLQLGTAIPLIPPSVLVNNPGLAAQLSSTVPVPSTPSATAAVAAPPAAKL